MEKAFIEPTGTLLIVALLFFPVQGKGLPLLGAHERELRQGIFVETSQKLADFCNQKDQYSLELSDSQNKDA